MLEINLQENITGALIKSVAEMATSRICGFIVYNKKHANVAKVLRDQDYWAEFDAISGANWPIFCIRPLDEKLRHVKGGGSGNGMSMLVMVDKEPYTNLEILNYFGLHDSERELPCFVLFAWDDNDNLCMNAYRIDDSTLENTHSSLRKIISVISETEQAILDEYKGTTSVFRNAALEIDALRMQEQFKKFYATAIPMLRPVFRLIKFLQG